MLACLVWRRHKQIQVQANKHLQNIIQNLVARWFPLVVTHIIFYFKCITFSFSRGVVMTICLAIALETMTWKSTCDHLTYLIIVETKDDKWWGSVVDKKDVADTCGRIHTLFSKVQAWLWRTACIQVFLLLWHSYSLCKMCLYGVFKIPSSRFLKIGYKQHV